jgi:phosphoribosylanthranilate isomerase
MAKKTQVKICGITTEDALNAAVKNSADYVGFVFYPQSPRHISIEKAKNLAKLAPSKISIVAVVVDATNDELDYLFSIWTPHYLQLHGDETVARVAEIQRRYGVPVIKAISVLSTDDLARSRTYEGTADMLLFDAKVPTAELPGGNGISFDWTLLKTLNFSLPWFLSGGLNLNNIEQALRITNPPAVDASSGLESEPGIKDPDLIAAFLERIKGNNE